jgi:hypothetical protein
MVPREILFLLWAIFLDAHEVFSQQIQNTDAISESQLKYATSFLRVGRIPIDILGVPVSQFGADGSSGTTTTELSLLSSSTKSSGKNLFKPAIFVSPKTLVSVPDDISAIKMRLVQKHP